MTLCPLAPLPAALLIWGVLAFPAAAQPPVDFNAQIRPLLSDRCFACHGPDEAERAAGLRLDTPDGVIKDRGGYAAIVPGKPGESELIERLTTDDPFMRMPPEGKGDPLSEQEIDRIRRWIAQGAPYANHWSYEKPVRPTLPEVRDGAWPRNPIDRFVLARLEAERLVPSPEADRRTLARRVAIDLTGLPPTWPQVERFVDDRRPGAYERYVDRLLASPAFGERWARVWLDLARYADSAGYADDPPRTIWAYRDYVIKSLNENKPFDEFTVEQIAGDLLKDPTREQLVATAFHRNTMTNNEGGTNDEEFRNVAVVDRVNTTMSVWMGTTMACAQCHTHKFDPITQAEYFELFAFFNQSQDADRRDERPVLKLWTDQQRDERERLQQRLTELRESKPESDELASVKKQLDAIQPRTTVPIMRELPGAKRRTTKIQIRGNYKNTSEEVSAGTPEAFHAFGEDLPRNRLGLAEWLVDPDNPLTPRVIANRHWEQLFGIGIVETSEDFGSQGDPPSHPRLLDWLAVELRDSGWDLKRLLRLIVTSATYRQSSVVTDRLIEVDPDNRLFARGPRFRLSAEMIRDQALRASGLLSQKMFGPPVRPPQPSLGLRAAFGSATDWQTSGGADRYRRGLYTQWRRSSPYPSLATFDAPNRQVCTLRRSRTNTPLQALVTLNDPVYVEAAGALAQQMIASGERRAQRIRAGVRRCLLREPTEAELDRLTRLVENASRRFGERPEMAAKLAEQAPAHAPVGAGAVELATWTVVGNVLLNLDEMFLKR